MDMKLLIMIRTSTLKIYVIHNVKQFYLLPFNNRLLFIVKVLIFTKLAPLQIYFFYR